MSQSFNNCRKEVLDIQKAYLEYQEMRKELLKLKIEHGENSKKFKKLVRSYMKKMEEDVQQFQEWVESSIVSDM